MCKWSMMQSAAQQRKEESARLIAEARANGFGAVVAPVGMRNVTPANMKRLVRGDAVVEPTA